MDWKRKSICFSVLSGVEPVQYLPPCFESLDSSLFLSSFVKARPAASVVMFVLACTELVQIFVKRISAINRVMTTLPRSAKTIRDIPEDIQLKLGASLVYSI